MGFPRFLYNDSKDPDSIGPVIFHMNFPRAVFRVKFLDRDPSKFMVKIESWVDIPTEEQADKTSNDLVEWFDKFLQQTKK